LIETDPTLDETFLKVLQDHTAGDPMRAEVKWTNLSRRQIAARMAESGTRVGRDVVSQLLRRHGYRKRKASKKRTMGHHRDRNAQFEKIARLKKKYSSAGLPVISIDTKKKELLGDFYREGRIETQGTIKVNDHDFGSAGSGVVIPHGVYDVGRNEGSLHLNTSHDTSELACDSIAAWWGRHGRAGYPRAKKLLVLCDGGGSNSATRYVFKEGLQKLATRLGIEIRIAHYPPYCSKYNPIEHRLFPHVTRACRGVIFRALEIARHYMAKTETTTGLKVEVSVLDKVYQTGRKCASGFKESMKIAFDKLLPKWNYRAVPRPA
jgi:Rhodopirellula transposase DDE domain